MASAPALNRLVPPGDQFTLITLRVLDEEPDADALIAWYRQHLHQLVVVNLLEGTPDFTFSASPPTEPDAAELIGRLASGEHGIDLTDRVADISASSVEPFGVGSRISSEAYDLGGGRWLSVLFGTLDWKRALASI